MHLVVAHGVTARKRLLLIKLERGVWDRCLEVGIGGEDDVFVVRIHAAVMAEMASPE